MTNNTNYTYHSATEPIRYTFLNDYMFHIVFQDTHILKGFLCALLRLEPEQIQSVTVTNPIDPGKTVNAKTFILDIRIVLNDHVQINLELQVVNQGNWPERSLSYLCRTFDGLYQGEDYGESDTAIHISILDFTLFPEYPEFYAKYRLLNAKNFHLYSDKFQLNVLDLNQMKLATEEDVTYGLDRWAALFKSTTWEEIKMLAEKDPYIDDAAQRLYEASYDRWVQDNCRAREEYLRNCERLNKLTAEKEAWQSEKEALQNEKEALQGENEALQGENETLQGENEALQGENATLQDKNAALENKNTELEDKIARLQEKLSQYEPQKP